VTPDLMIKSIENMNKGARNTAIILFAIAITIYFGFMLMLRSAAG